MPNKYRDAAHKLIFPENEKHLWKHLPGERARQYKLFEIYLSIPPTERNFGRYIKIIQDKIKLQHAEFAKQNPDIELKQRIPTKKSIESMKIRNRWNEREEAYTNYLKQKETEKHFEMLEKAKNMKLQVSTRMFQKLDERLKTDFNIRPTDIPRFAKVFSEIMSDALIYEKSMSKQLNLEKSSSDAQDTEQQEGMSQEEIDNIIFSNPYENEK